MFSTNKKMKLAAVDMQPKIAAIGLILNNNILSMLEIFQLLREQLPDSDWLTVKYFKESNIKSLSHYVASKLNLPHDVFNNTISDEKSESKHDRVSGIVSSNLPSHIDAQGMIDVLRKKRDKGNFQISNLANLSDKFAPLFDVTRKLLLMGYPTTSEENIDYELDIYMGGVTDAIIPFLRIAYIAYFLTREPKVESPEFKEFYRECVKFKPKDSGSLHGKFFISSALAVKINLLGLLQQDSILQYDNGDSRVCHRNRFVTTHSSEGTQHNSQWIEITDRDGIFSFSFKGRFKLNLAEVLSPKSKAFFLPNYIPQNKIERKQFFRIAEKMQDAGNLGSALDLYSRIIKSDPDWAPAYYKRGLVLKAKKLYSLALKEMQKAGQIFEKYFFSIMPSDVSPMRFAMMASWGVIKKDLQELEKLLLPAQQEVSSSAVLEENAGAREEDLVSTPLRHKVRMKSS